MTKNIFNVLILSCLLLSFKSIGEDYLTFKLFPSYYCLKQPLKLPIELYDVEENYKVYIHFKEPNINFEYYSLFDSTLFFFFRDLTNEGIADSLNPLPNYKTPVLISFNHNKYLLNTDINLIGKSLPSNLYNTVIGSSEYLILEEDILSLQPPTGYTYLTLKFNKKKLLKYKFTFSKQKKDKSKLISELDNPKKT